MKKILLFILFASTLAVTLGGCVAGPQYFPASLEGEPTGSMAELRVDLRTQSLLIDGRVAIHRETYLEPDPIFIAPGTHQLRYTVYGETTQWLNITESMKQKGFTLSANDKFYEKEVSGFRVTRSALSVERFGWNRHKRKVLLEAGKLYNLSGF